MSNVLKLTVAFAAFWLLALLLLLMLSPLKAGAPWLPDSPPRESQRIRHSRGFSIIPPPGWVARVFDYRTAEDTVEATLGLHTGSKGVRYAPHISITMAKWSPDLLGFNAVRFHEWKAYDKIRPVVGGGDVPYFRYTLCVTNNGFWYELNYYTPTDRDKPLYTNVPPAMMPYLQSFRPAL